ncbi:ROK family transcriptional regulator [Glycomyces sp. TRM65418]|uniref:ROK family transcriptional regulator n=1 Tax=Glycomyces sp. TRM65418 TaxID=2867006 RepID=UPI001CE6EC43|nr:ROK family transcriptional regulator [Glycomyces sp. TRM65418]MCC3761493.1 ROK family transcriptional regulator [Glycomyces sp. TRM65418]QZD55591.1 ROK family transcriptional regulator [Glycomyces sp. TRM65418]
MRSFGSETRVPTLSAVLDLIRERSGVSRVELAEATGLTQATMTHAVRKLIALGFVHEVGTAASGRGTPRRLLALRPEACRMIGVQFDRFAAVGVVVDLAGRVMVQRAFPAPGERPPDEVVPEFAGHVRSMLESAGVAPSEVLGIGLATYGPQDRDEGVLLTPQPSPEWRGYPLAATLSEATGLPVAVENDATAAGIGVHTLGSASSSFAVVFMSGGIGSGLILDGFPYRGVTSNGLELGHISVDAAGARCSCGNWGCLDTVAGPMAVVEQARRDRELTARLGLGGDRLADFKAVGRAAAAGDAAAAALIESSMRTMGVATVTLVNLFDVGRVVLAGNAFTDAGAIYRDGLQQILNEAVFMRHVHSVRVDLADDVSRAAAVGAAIVVLRNLLESPNLGDRAAVR